MNPRGLFYKSLFLSNLHRVHSTCAVLGSDVGHMILLQQPSVSPHGAPHEAVSRLHESTYMVKYKEVIKYVSSIFILRQMMQLLHLLPEAKLAGGILYPAACLSFYNVALLMRRKTG